ncbi:hypothetical protein [Lactobacillus sp.]|uniref:hypothetical protein n=1 Tax=Lactobacillus sp. TaxID=1591 RepID=UPI003EFC7E91
MLLADFLQLLTDLGGQNALYLQVKDQTLPLSKFVLAREDCQLLCGKKPLTLAKFRQLTGKGSKSIPLSFYCQEKEISVYGIQILPAERKIVCK